RGIIFRPKLGKQARCSRNVIGCDRAVNLLAMLRSVHLIAPRASVQDTRRAVSPTYKSRQCAVRSTLLREADSSHLDLLRLGSRLIEHPESPLHNIYGAGRHPD